MRKADLNNLCAGNKVISKKDSTVLSIVGLDKEQGKAIMDNGKVYSFSTICRWYDLAPVEEVDEPIKPTITEEKSVDDENHEDHTGKANSHVVEGKNSIEDIFYRFSRVLDEHNCYFKQYKQYIAVLTDRKKGTLLQVIRNRQGSVNIDVKRGIWEKLKTPYKTELQRKYNAYVYDKTRGYIRFNNMEDVNTFTVLLLVALS